MAAPASGMLYADYLKAFTRMARRWRPTYQLSVVGRARSLPGPVPLVRLRSARPRRGGVMLMAGFHGEEPAGPLTLLRFLDHVLGRAMDLKVPVCIYPVVNPFGFDNQRRSTVDGQYTNAGFVHEEDPTGPEVALLREDMAAQGAEVFLDLHEDDRESRCYLYSFGDADLARNILEAARPFIPIVGGPLSHAPNLSAHQGEIREHHDGSSEDFMSHQGTLASFALETPTRLDLRVRQAVHLSSVEECLVYAARKRGGARTASSTRALVAQRG